MAGGFEPVSKPIFSDGVPSPFEFQLLPEDWDHFRKLKYCTSIHTDTQATAVLFTSGLYTDGY